ncbi:MAG: glycosyltransferase family 2 protein [Streptosporangiaceae bacterium]
MTAAPLTEVALPLASSPRLSVIMPARQESERIAGVLDLLFESVRSACEVLVVVDAADDPTAAVVRAYAGNEGRLRLLVNEYGTGPAAAIRFGLHAATAPVVVVTMADGSDDPAQIDELAALVEGGAVLAAASRYAPGGRQLGGPALKGALSRLAGTSLRVLARAGTTDATNSFKAYSAEFARLAGVDSRHGFEIGIELTAKARRLRLPVAEIPTTWRGRADGRSGFRLARWLPAYLRWYLFCFGRPLIAAQLTGDQVPARRGGSNWWLSG